MAEAEGGTLFLDEVAELSPLAQARLLRFLQEGEYRRLGETHAAQGRRAAGERHQRGPRRARPAGALPPGPLVPPQDRAPGGAAAARARRTTCCCWPVTSSSCRRARAAWPRRGSPPAAEDALVAHAWPGNVRELESEMLRLVGASSRGQRRLPSELSAELAEAPRALRHAAAGAAAASSRRWCARRSRGTRGAAARAAAELGITRQALVGEAPAARGGGGGAILAAHRGAGGRVTQSGGEARAPARACVRSWAAGGCSRSC